MRSGIMEAARAARAPRAFLAAALLAASVLVSAPAVAESEYDPSDAGNPVRIGAYILHPVGVIYDYLLLRPAWWVGSHEPFRTMFGRKD